MGGKSEAVSAKQDSYARSDKCHEKSRFHDDRADRHETVAQYLLAQDKGAKAERHRDAAGMHVEAGAHYRRAAQATNRQNDGHAKNYEDRGDDKAAEAKAYEDKHGLELDSDKDESKK